MTLLSDETAVVTGGASGNGRAIAERFAEHGADVVVADIRENPRKAETPTHEVIEAETDASATFVECDVTEVEQLDDAVEAAAEFGGVDVMVNNAGYLREQDFFEVTESEFDDIVDVNLKGVFFGAQAAAERMADGDGGTIINLSSVEGIRGAAGHAAYGATKGGIRALTYALADELGDAGVRVNALHPGLIDTAMTEDDAPIVGTDREEQFLEMIPQGRVGDPDDVAGGAVFLASDLASYANGESLVLDGGLTSSL